MDIVVIGSSAASKSVVSTLLTEGSTNDNITVITEDQKLYYSRVLLPNYIAGELNENDLYFIEKDFLKDERLNILKASTVTSINTITKKVLINGRKFLHYDKLIITTGASPAKININANLRGVYYLRNFEDALAIKDRAKEVNDCIIIGGGLVSLKAAWALRNLGKNVTILVESDQLLSRVMDKYSSKMVKNIYEENGINIILSGSLEGFDSDSNGFLSSVKYNGGQIIKCGLAVIGKGVRPNIELAINTGIQTKKGIIVNNKMETSIKDIYAAGDVTESESLLKNETDTFTLWPDAMAQGKIAAYNILGFQKEYCGGMNMNSVVFFNTPFVSMGLIMDRDIKNCDVYTSYDNLGKIYRKIVVKDKKLVGAILAGDISFAGMLFWDIKSGRIIENPSMYLSLSGLENIYITRNQIL